MKSVVLINLFGGPSHIDMFDMKPDAPENVRGEFKPMATSVPGTSICAHLPRTAKWMQHSSPLRTVTHNLNSHHPYSVLTGWGEGPERPGVKRDDHPSMGSVCQYLGLGPRDVPGYVFMPAYPGHSQNPRPGAHAGYLGPACDPLFTLCQPDLNGRAISMTRCYHPARHCSLEPVPARPPHPNDCTTVRHYCSTSTSLYPVPKAARFHV